MPEGFNSDVIRYCEISNKLTSWTEKAPICKGTVKCYSAMYKLNYGVPTVRTVGGAG